MEHQTVTVTTEADIREVVEETGGVVTLKPGETAALVLFYVNSEGEYKQRFETGGYIEHEPENTIHIEGEPMELDMFINPEDPQPFQDEL